MTRCDVALVGQKAVAGLRHAWSWTVWWVMQGGDDHAALSAADRRLLLNYQVEEVHRAAHVAGAHGAECTVRCLLTGDGKSMLAANWAPGLRCWVCSVPHRE